MLYIDQLNQVGFPYDAPSNGTLDLVTENITLAELCGLFLRNFNAEQYILPWDFSIQKPLSTVNDTANAGPSSLALCSRGQSERHNMDEFPVAIHLIYRKLSGYPTPRNCLSAHKELCTIYCHCKVVTISRL